MPCLILCVRFHDARYHGRVDDLRPDWPPSPARVFQALVAGVAKGATIEHADMVTLEWLECLPPPTIAAPHAKKGEVYTSYVPDNDLDTKGGDPSAIGSIRAGKSIRPYLFDAAIPLLYVWPFTEPEVAEAQAVCNLAERLYQLGRGVDMAWAAGEVLTAEVAQERLAAYPWRIYRPGGTGSEAFDCPRAGALASLERRYAAFGRRFAAQYAQAPTRKDPDRRRMVGKAFSQPSKPQFRQVAYDARPLRLLFDIRRTGKDGFARQPLTKIVVLTERLRNDAAARLISLAERSSDAVGAAQIERLVIGRDAGPADKPRRMRIIPLPSIGHSHVDPSIRRVLIEVPPDCPIPPAHVEWAFEGMVPEDGDATGGPATLVASSDLSMAEKHYGIAMEAGADSAFLWRTVTPAALPENAQRRRIDPKRMRDDAKGGKERAAEEAHAASAVLQALRHVGTAAPARSVRVQREPFGAKGARAETFAPETGTQQGRFRKEQLWHVEVRFVEPVAGPLAIGDGRWLGLGLMAPVKTPYDDTFVFHIDEANRPPVGSEVPVLRAARRALMALDRVHGGSGKVSRVFSGHEPDGAPSRPGSHNHVFLAATGDSGKLSRLYIFSPLSVDRRAKLDSYEMRRFGDVVSRLKTLRSREFGLLHLSTQVGPSTADPVVSKAHTWISATPYKPTRHSKKESETEASLVRDVQEECVRRGLPNANVNVLEVARGPRSGISARIEIQFSKPVQGPVLLGKGAHFGLGLFKAAAPGVVTSSSGRR